MPVVFLFHSATKAAAIGASTKHRLVHPMLFERDIYGGVRRGGGSKDLTTFKTSVTQEKTNTPLTFFKAEAATRATRSLDRGSSRQQQGRAT